MTTLRKKDRKAFATDVLQSYCVLVHSDYRFRAVVFVALLLFFTCFLYFSFDLVKTCYVATKPKNYNMMIEYCLRGRFTFDELFNAYTSHYNIDNDFSEELRNVMLKSTDTNRNAYIDNKNECEIFDKHFNIIIS